MIPAIWAEELQQRFAETLIFVLLSFSRSIVLATSKSNVWKANHTIYFAAFTPFLWDPFIDLFFFKFNANGKGYGKEKNGSTQKCYWKWRSWKYRAIKSNNDMIKQGEPGNFIVLFCLSPNRFEANLWVRRPVARFFSPTVYSLITQRYQPTMRMISIVSGPQGRPLSSMFLFFKTVVSTRWINPQSVFINIWSRACLSVCHQPFVRRSWPLSEWSTPSGVLLDSKFFVTSSE